MNKKSLIAIVLALFISEIAFAHECILSPTITVDNQSSDVTWELNTSAGTKIIQPKSTTQPFLFSTIDRITFINQNNDTSYTYVFNPNKSCFPTPEGDGVYNISIIRNNPVLPIFSIKIMQE